MPRAIRTWLGSGTHRPKATPQSYEAAAKSLGAAPICPFFFFSRYKDDLNHTKARRSPHPGIRPLPHHHRVWGAAAVVPISAWASTAGSWKIPPFPRGKTVPVTTRNTTWEIFGKHICLLGHMPATAADQAGAPALPRRKRSVQP